MMTFEEFIVAFVELKTKTIENGKSVSFDKAMEWAISWFDSAEKARKAYKDYIDGVFASGCPLRINRISLSEETEQDIGCINNSSVECLECWKLCLIWANERKNGFWRLNDEI